MGASPAKTFPPPTPFGSVPQTNNLSQAQAPTFINGPGFAAASGYDQTPANQGPGNFSNQQQQGFDSDSLPIGSIFRNRGIYDARPGFGGLYE